MWDSLLHVPKVLEYVELCRNGEMGPSSLLTKCNLAITALQFQRMEYTNFTLLAETNNARASYKMRKKVEQSSSSEDEPKKKQGPTKNVDLMPKKAKKRPSHQKTREENDAIRQWYHHQGRERSPTLSHCREFPIIYIV